MRQFAVIRAAVIFQPCGVVRVLVQVLRANAVVLTFHHAAQAREVAFHHVRMLAVVAVALAVVQALHLIANVQQIPMAGLIG